MRFALNKKNISKTLISILYIFATSFMLAFLCLPTRDYKLDRVACSLNDYNSHDYYNGFQSPILRLHQDSKDGSTNRSERYDDIFEQFYYNSFVKHLRQFATNDITDELLNKKINVFCQKTYMCRNTELSDGGHYVDYGVFASYYGDNIYEKRPDGDPRTHGYFPYTGCVTFAYISDAFADSLIEHYKNVEPEIEIKNYEDLIFKKPVLPIVAAKENNDGTVTEYQINVSINNVLYREKRHAYRISELYGDTFALIDLYSYGKKTREWADLACEMELKADPFGTKNVFQGLEYFGYNPNNSQYKFYKYDYSSNSYYIDSEIAEKYLESYNNNISNVLFYCLLFIVIFIFSIFNLFIIRKDKVLRNMAIAGYLLTAILFGVIVSFTYFYPLWSLAPVSLIVVGILINLFKGKTNVQEGGIDYFEIRI